jgi:hypothetical protein
MADAVRYLLPAIPTVLYGGLGATRSKRLSVMRKACSAREHYAKAARCRRTSTASFRRCWRSSTRRPTSSPQRVQDELIGQMSELLGIDYDVLALDMTESESRQRAWSATRRHLDAARVA